VLAAPRLEPCGELCRWSAGGELVRNRIATDALKFGARRKLRIVDRELIVRVFGDQEARPED